MISPTRASGWQVLWCPWLSWAGWQTMLERHHALWDHLISADPAAFTKSKPWSLSTYTYKYLLYRGSFRFVTTYFPFFHSKTQDNTLNNVMTEIWNWLPWRTGQQTGGDHTNTELSKPMCLEVNPTMLLLLSELQHVCKVEAGNPSVNVYCSDSDFAACCCYKFS